MSTREAAVTERVGYSCLVEEVALKCIECSLCVQQCEFLSLFCESPRQLAVSFMQGDLEKDSYIPYLCTLCGLCEEVCPLDLNIGDMCFEVRQKLVRNGIGPLPAHAAVEKEQKRVMSDHFSLSFPDPATGGCSRVFIPGCHLSGYSPALVMASYDWLRERLPDTGFMLRCCGAPSRDLGQQDVFEVMMADMQAEIAGMGATEIIVACPKCGSTIKTCSLPFTVKTIYEIMAEAGPIKTAFRGEHTFALHDPCSGRRDGYTQECVRSILRSSGCEVEEFRNHGTGTTCCGMGGMVAYVSPDMSDAVRDRRLEETPTEIVTYCAGCRDAFAGRRPALHILDLLFNPDWEDDLVRPPHNRAMQQDNQWILKTLLSKKYGLQD